MATSTIDRSKLKSIRVLFEDDALLAVSKPQGMPVHGGAGEDGPTLIDLLEAAYPERVDLHLAHRLDKPTSGVVLVAKSRATLKAVQAAWDEAEKTYLAVALGTISEDRTIDAPLADRDGRKRAARTEVHMVRRLDALTPKATLVRLTIATGRTHQIRLHLQGAGHPVLMDEQHGDFGANKAWARAVKDAGAKKPKHLMLHALRLSVRHPAEKRRLRLTAEPPPTWAEMLRAASGAGGDEVDVFQEVL